MWRAFLRFTFSQQIKNYLLFTRDKKITILRCIYLQTCGSWSVRDRWPCVFGFLWSICGGIFSFWSIDHISWQVRVKTDLFRKSCSESQKVKSSQVKSSQSQDFDFKFLPKNFIFQIKIERLKLFRIVKPVIL